MMSDLVLEAEVTGMHLPGLSLVSANPDLHTEAHGIVVIGLGISAAALLGQWLVTRLFSWLRWGKVMLSRESSAIVGLEKEEPLLPWGAAKGSIETYALGQKK